MKAGLVFGTFAPMHEGHMDVIRTALAECDKVVAVCCGHDGDRGYPDFPLDKRHEYAVEALKNMDVRVMKLEDTAVEVKKDWTDEQVWEFWAARMRVHLSEEGMVDYYGDELIWYTSEADYEQLLTGAGQKVRKCEKVRDVSATKIRNAPAKYAGCVIKPFDKGFEGRI